MKGFLAARTGIGIMALLLTSATAQFAHAQAQGLRGIVTDTTGHPVPDADVGVPLLRRLTRTDDSGRFVLPVVDRDSVKLTVRRLGYTAVTRTVATHEPARIVLERSAAVLEAVDARAERVREGIEGFYRRAVVGMGTYFTREEIEDQNTMRASDVLRTTPGIRFVRVAAGLGVRFNSSAIVRRDCTPMIWVDGQRAPGLEIDDLPASDIEGIELYSGPATTPLQFSQYSSASTCGTIVVWTRQPGL